MKNEEGGILAIRNRMIQQIKSINNVCTDEYLSDKDNEFLLCLVHPTDYSMFRTALGLDKKVKAVVKPEVL